MRVLFVMAVEGPNPDPNYRRLQCMGRTPFACALTQSEAEQLVPVAAAKLGVSPALLHVVEGWVNV